MNTPKIKTNRLDDFRLNETVRFLNKNTGCILQGKIKGMFECKNDCVGVSLEGNSEMKTLNGQYLSCFRDNYNKINVSWFNLDDIEIL